MSEQREVYRTLRKSRGFSNHTDAGTNHADADCQCWWCFRPVLGSLHDFGACHDGMFFTVTQYRRKPAVSEPVELPPSLFGDQS